jgi:hypothetical protein
LLRLSTPLTLNVKTLIYSRNRLRALSGVIVILAGRYHEEHKNANRCLAVKPKAENPGGSILRRLRLEAAAENE